MEPVESSAPAAARGGEADLVRRAKAGDVGAFEALYRESVGRVYALCLRLSGEPARAEDLTQEVFVRAWRRLATFQEGSRFSTWLHAVATHAAVDERRRSMRRPLSLVADPPEPGGRPGPAPGDGIDLERAIGSLPPGCRHVFVLHDVEGLRHEEIARRLGVSEGTSKSQLHRARRLLREALS